jgi:hypothetical protein
MSSPTSDMPRKVIDKAVEMGAHNDCIYAGVRGTCNECFDIIMKAFDVFYADATSPEDMMLRILDDYAAEQEIEKEKSNGN